MNSESNKSNEEKGPALPDTNGTVVLGDSVKTDVSPESFPDFKISGCFSSHMVLQRRQKAAVFGFSRHPGMTVTGKWNASFEETVSTSVGDDGRFRLEFSPREASSEPSAMIVSSPYGSYVLSDILVGDVWLIGGQSNAECWLGHCIHTTPELKDELSAGDNYRLFRQSQAVAFEFRDDCAYPRQDVIEPSWHWKKPDLEGAVEFSAMGIYFAKELIKHTDVPIGLMMLCPGGACLRELMPRELSVSLGYTEGANMPVGGYFNTLISPLIGISFYGQLFFQGESEGGWKHMAYSYDKDLKAMIDDERARFGRNFPFYNVQLSSYREEGRQYFPYLHVVRVKQFDAVSEISSSHLAVSMDLGSLPEDNDFAHSPHKSELGRRLAMQVWAYEYGGKSSMPDPAEYESPAPVSVSVSDGSAAVKFANAGGGLKTRAGNSPAGFGFLTEGSEEPVSAEAYVTAPDTVTVKLPAKLGGKRISAVTYALFHPGYPENANIVNSFGLPCPAFCLKC